MLFLFLFLSFWPLESSFWGPAWWYYRFKISRWPPSLYMEYPYGVLSSPVLLVSFQKESLFFPLASWSLATALGVLFSPSGLCAASFCLRLLCPVITAAKIEFGRPGHGPPPYSMQGGLAGGGEGRILPLGCSVCSRRIYGLGSARLSRRSCLKGLPRSRALGGSPFASLVLCKSRN